MLILFLLPDKLVDKREKNDVLFHMPGEKTGIFYLNRQDKNDRKHSFVCTKPYFGVRKTGVRVINFLFENIYFTFTA